MGIGDFISGIFGSQQQVPEAAEWGGKRGGADEDVNRFRNLSEQVGNRAAPGTDWGQANNDYARSQQGGAAMGDAMGLARSAALGQAPSVAAIQQQQGLAQAQQQALSLGASARGGGANLAAAQRAAMRSNESQAGNAIGQAAALRAGEMATARGQYGSLADAYTGAADRSRSLSQNQAQFGTQTELANRGMNDTQQRAYLGAEQNVRQGQLAAEQQRRGFEAGAQANNAKTANDNTMGLIKMGAGAAMMASDIRLKTDVSPQGDREADWTRAKGLADAVNGGPDDASEDDTIKRMIAEQKARESAAEAELKKANDEAFAKAEVADRKRRFELHSRELDGEGGAPSGSMMGEYNEAFKGGPPTDASTGLEAKNPAMLSPNQQAGMNMMNGGDPGAGASMSPQQQAGLSMLMSDERAKSSRSSGNTLDELLGAFGRSASTYAYKDERDQPSSSPKPGARYAGVMAQEVERVPEIGHSIVTDTPRGKALEGKPLMSALAAGEGRLWNRLQELERDIGKGRRNAA